MAGVYRVRKLPRGMPEDQKLATSKTAFIKFMVSKFGISDAEAARMWDVEEANLDYFPPASKKVLNYLDLRSVRKSRGDMYGLPAKVVKPKAVKPKAVKPKAVKPKAAKPKTVKRKPRTTKRKPKTVKRKPRTIKRKPRTIKRKPRTTKRKYVTKKGLTELFRGKSRAEIIAALAKPVR